MVLQVRSADGGLVAERDTTNMVLRGGARLIANLFAGSGGAGRIDTIRIGFAGEPGNSELLALTPPDATLAIPDAALSTALPAESFEIKDDLAGFVRVNVSARFSPSREIAGVSEAGLLAGDTLYNQVIFEPVTLRNGQDVTFFWQIDFPFG